MVLKFKAYTETIGEAENMKKEIEEMQAKIATLESNTAEMTKLFSVDQPNLMLTWVPDKKKNDRFVPQAYNEKHRRLEPIPPEVTKEILGMKDDENEVIVKVEPYVGIEDKMSSEFVVYDYNKKSKTLKPVY